jgi:hypothetical protein
MKRVAVLQSNYIPWKGYFDLINLVDEFILYDTAQFTKNDWRNRNRIKTPQGAAWITVPVVHRFGQTIEEVAIKDPSWRRKHWMTITQFYHKAAHFTDYQATLEELYLGDDEPMLSQVNFRFLQAICAMLGITTKLSCSREYELVEGQTERLVHLCRQAGATHYLSGPAARDYVDEGLFEQAGIVLEYMEYGGYPEYRQLYPPFEHAVTVLDLILNEGPHAQRFMKSFGRK